MASSPNPNLLFLSLLFITVALSFFSAASARPCKTLLISSYTFSVKPLYPNPNSVNNNNPSSSSGFVTIVTEISQHRRSSSAEIFLNRRRFPIAVVEPRQVRQEEDDSPLFPFGLSSYDMSSLRDRTKDILSVVVALLFGVGCGALTAASMYLVWSLFSTRYEYRYDEFDGEDDDEDDEEDVVGPKKMGYVKIPEADFVPKQAKEV